MGFSIGGRCEPERKRRSAPYCVPACDCDLIQVAAFVILVGVAGNGLAERSATHDAISLLFQKQRINFRDTPCVRLAMGMHSQAPPANVH